jgi:hypothetical protein
MYQQVTITPGKYSPGTFDEICNNNKEGKDFVLYSIKIMRIFF